jgi:hypothetical protein
MQSSCKDKIGHAAQAFALILTAQFLVEPSPEYSPAWCASRLHFTTAIPCPNFTNPNDLPVYC